MELDDFLDETLAPDLDRDGPWQIGDESTADWAARKIQRAHRQIAAKQAERDRIVAAADDWLERETKTLTDDALFFEGKLQDWLRREIDADPDGRKSRRLPCGATVKRTGGAPSLVVDDEQALVEWLTARDATAGLVEFVPNIDKAGLKKLRRDDDRLAWVDESTGDIVEVDGARIERGPWAYKVETGGGS